MKLYFLISLCLIINFLPMPPREILRLKGANSMLAGPSPWVVTP